MAAHTREHIEQFLECQVGVAEDIALAGLTVVGREQMAVSDIANVDHVQAGVDIRRHSAVQKIDNDLSRRRGLDIELANRRGRIHDHDRQSARGGALHDLLRHRFALFVVTDQITVACDPLLVRCIAVGVDSNGGDGAGVHDAANIGIGRRREDVRRAIDVGRVDLVGITGPEPVVGGAVIERIDATHCAAQRVTIEKVAHSDLRRQPGDVRA